MGRRRHRVGLGTLWMLAAGSAAAQDLPSSGTHGSVCSCALPDRESRPNFYPDTQAVFEANQAAGIDYCVHPYVDDDACERIRPATSPGRALDDRLRALGPETALSDRLVLWSQAFAPESPLRDKPVAELGPLFQPYPGRPHENVQLGSHFPRLFDSAELHRQRQAPAGTWMLVITPTDGGFTLGQPGAFGTPGPFPPATFTLEQDRTVTVHGPTQALFYDPCAMSFTASAVPAMRYDPATGALSGQLADAELAKRLARCRETRLVEAEAYTAAAVGFEFVMVVDHTGEQRLTAALQQPSGRTIPGDEHLAVEYGAYAVHEVRFGPEQAPTGFFRTAVHSECGSTRSTALQFHDGADWQQLSLSTEVEFCSP